MGKLWRAWLVMVALALALTACEGGASVAPFPAPEVAPTLAPLSLVIEPTPWSAAPLPTTEAARVFHWPSNGKPSLIFVYDDAAT